MNLYQNLLKSFKGYLSTYEILELYLILDSFHTLRTNADKTYDKNVDSLKRYLQDNLDASYVFLEDEEAYLNVFHSELLIEGNADLYLVVGFKAQILKNKTLTAIIRCSVDELLSITTKILNAYKLYLHAANLKTKLEFIEYDKYDDGFFYDDFMNIKTTKILNRQDILDEKIASLEKELETTTEETAGRMYSDVFLKNAIELLKAEKTYHKKLGKNISGEWYISKLLEEAETITIKQGFEMYTKGYYFRLKINKAAEESIEKEIEYNDFGTTFDNEE